MADGMMVSITESKPAATRRAADKAKAKANAAADKAKATDLNAAATAATLDLNDPAALIAATIDAATAATRSGAAAKESRGDATSEGARLRLLAYHAVRGDGAAAKAVRAMFGKDGWISPDGTVHCHWPLRMALSDAVKVADWFRDNPSGEIRRMGEKSFILDGTRVPSIGPRYWDGATDPTTRVGIRAAAQALRAAETAAKAAKDKASAAASAARESREDRAASAFFDRFNRQPESDADWFDAYKRAVARDAANKVATESSLACDAVKRLLGFATASGLFSASQICDALATIESDARAARNLIHEDQGRAESEASDLANAMVAASAE